MQANNKMTVKLAKDVTGLNSITSKNVNAETVKAGDTTVNNQGVTIAGGPSVTKGGINANGTKITNVAAGDVNSMSTDAVNGSQLYQTNQNVKAAKTVVKAGRNVTVDSSTGADGQSVYTVNADLSSVASAIGGTSSVDTKTGAVKAGLTVNGNTYNNVQDAVNAANTTVSSTDGSVKVTPTNNTNGSHNYDVSVDYSKVAENAAISYKANNSTAQTVTLKKGLDFTNGKNTTASVGADGVVKYDLNDDINLNSVTAKTIKGNTIKAGDTTITTDGMTITNGPSITKTGIDAGSKKITNVADGDISPTSKDAINGGQLVSYVAANKTILKDGKNTTVTGNGTKDDPYKVNVNDNLNLGEKGTNGKDGSIGVNGTNGSSVTINGKDGSIGMVGEDGKDGLTMKSAKGQDGVDGANGMTRIVYEDDGHVPHEVATLDDGLKFAGNTGSVAKKLNSTMTIKGNGTKEDKEYDASNIKTVVDAQGDLVIGLDKNLKADTVTVGGQGKDGADGINGAIGVKGADGKDGVTISSIGKDGTNGTDGHIGINGKDGASADIHVVKGVNGIDGTDGYNGTDGIDRIVYEDHNENTQTVATMNDGMKYGGDVGNVINKKLNGQVNVVGGITDSSKLSTEDNIGVVSDGSDNLKVRLSKDLKGLDSVTTKTVTADTGNITTVNASTVNVGDTTITTGGMTIQNGSAGQDVTLNKDGLNNGGNKITNVAPGDISSTSTDAVNGSQLYGTETRINRLGNRINHVGAGAAALAGLHPLDFDPDDKWDFAAGYGNYKNANAVAIGAYYRPNEDTMFSVGGSFSGGENMVNVGVSWKFGQKSHISRSRVSMAKDMLAMKNQIETLTKKLAAYESGQPVKLAPIATGAMTFPDVPENHWAYEYVKNLAERGYLKGYPDGEFKGDRAMTRYEYAAIIYRALQNGAPSDGNMTRSVDDFGPELVKVQNIDRFRVDRISGKDNDRHKVERVRVNDKDDKAQNVYRDVYGNHIQK
jgi:autotransporter adhesin